MNADNVSKRGRELSSDEELRELFGRMRTVAVLGIKPESRLTEPSFYVPAYVQKRGYKVLPVPVYYPEVQSILGEPVTRVLTELPRPVDVVNVFRRSEDLTKHEAELLALRPGLVWLQQGIRDDAFAARLRDAGIDVVQDRCLLVELRRLGP